MQNKKLAPSTQIGSRITIALIAGLLFGAGLLVSGMTDANKVIGFLNVLSPNGWDPSLAFVMGGAILVHTAAYLFKKKRITPIFESTWKVPLRQDITPRLIIGSLLFGIGWGISGYCPGPALVSLTSLSASPLIFFGGLIIGMTLYQALESYLARVSGKAQPTLESECG